MERLFCNLGMNVNLFKINCGSGILSLNRHPTIIATQIKSAPHIINVYFNGMSTWVSAKGKATKKQRNIASNP